MVNRENGFVVGMSAEEIADGIENALFAPRCINARNVEISDVYKLLQLI